MKKSLYCILFTLACSVSFADTTGVYFGGGAGYGVQNISLANTNGTVANTNGVTTSPTLRGFLGYQFASWIDVETGYTYISQSTNWNNLGNPSTTIYDLVFMPGYTIPLSPVTIYARLGVDSISSNLNTSWYNQVFSNMTGSFEWGFGVKVEIPETRTFVRLEYVDYGQSNNNTYNSMSVSPTAVMLNAGYIF